MNPVEPDTEQLLACAAQGDQAALGQLLQRHRPRLRNMIARRLDRRLQARLDPSEVLQETLVEAAQRLTDYACLRPLPLDPSPEWAARRSDCIGPTQAKVHPDHNLGRYSVASSDKSGKLRGPPGTLFGSRISEGYSHGHQRRPGP
jgi:hypothetical protein